MKEKLIIHLMTKQRMNSWLLKADLDSIDEIYEKYWVKNMIFYKWDTLDYIHFITKLEKQWIYVKNYLNKQDLIEKIKNYSEKFEIVSIYTSLELLINLSNILKNELGFERPNDIKIFRDKFLQRKLLQESWNEELGVKYLKWEPFSLDLKEIEEKIWYPFIMKPINWVQSSGVAKIEKKSDFEKYIADYKDFHDRLKARWIDNKEIIVEEFIDWWLYTLDYFVTSEGKVIFSRPAQEILWIDFWVNDYFVVARVASTKVEADLKESWLEKFILDTVKATKLKNTFVHHEFKLTKKWNLKTIELNWRLGWWRMELYRNAYWMNMFEMFVNENMQFNDLINNNIVFNICATKRWRLIWIDEKIFDLIKKRETVISVKFENKFIWKEVWLTKDWFVKMWTIQLLSDDLEKITKDFEYIKSKYKKLLIIKTREEIIEERRKNKKTLFKKIKDFIRS